MTNFLKNDLFQFFYRHLAALGSIAVTSLALKFLSTYLENQIITLLFLLPVMVSTVLWGLTPGILSSFSAFLAFNYLFVPPYHTFQVHKTQDLITLIMFLIVAVVMSQLIGQARAGMTLARSREWEATRMYELISALAGLQDTESIAKSLATHTLETFHLERVEVHIPDNTKPVSFTAAVSGAPPSSGENILRMALKTARSEEGVIYLCCSSAQLSTEETRLLEAYTSQGALALERIRLARGEYKSRVLEESDRLKSSLLNSVSHELRSPLAAIKASVSSLRSGTVEWNTAARKELLATIEEETDHLNLLVGNLLDMSRIESGALKPQIRWNSLAEIAMGVVTRMRGQLQNHALKIDLPEDLPLVPTDYVMIGQVFTNLFSNSVKYAPEKTLISLRIFKDHDVLHTEITNQSPPVPEEHLRHIFDKFHRITQVDRVTGTGLGLSICKGLIEAHGGEIWAENQPDCFAFHFTLPLTLNGSLPDLPEELGDGKRPADLID